MATSIAHRLGIALPSRGAAIGTLTSDQSCIDTQRRMLERNRNLLLEQVNALKISRLLDCGGEPDIVEHVDGTRWALDPEMSLTLAVFGRELGLRWA